MNLQPIIKSKMDRFACVRDFKGNDNELFEQFVNESILIGNQNGNGSLSDALLEDVNVGGSNDMGIDGICIKLNGMLIHSIEEAEDILDSAGYSKIEIEYIFIQSKYKSKVDSKEFGAFVDGIENFMGDTIYQPINKKIEKWLKIKSYLLEDKALSKWEDNPVLRLYYVVMGEWEPSHNQHTMGICKKFEGNHKARYKDIYINFIDERNLKKICDNNENQFSTSIDIIDTLELPEVPCVDGSVLVVCSATEFIKMATTDDHLLRKSLFNDNVRDYQGDTTINQEILTTVETCPEHFILMNNGITIVCSKMISGNRKLTVHNPRIVNGCQTCSILYRALRTGDDLSQVVVTAKIIATDDTDVTRKILRGTNRQNIVYDEAFECTREFHKELEELFEVISNEHEADRIVYERRSKQYNELQTIKSYQKISFKTLIQSFVSVFLLQPHIGYRHESRLLQKYKGQIFLDSQSKWPYYVASLISSKIESLLKKQQIDKKYRPYKTHLEMIILLLICNESFNINKEKEVDRYCKKILDVVYDNEKFNKIANVAVEKYDECVEIWIERKGTQYKYGIKDSEEFTQLVYYNLTSRKLVFKQKYEGKVIKVSRDKYGKYYGIIYTEDDEKIFFHSDDNKGLDFQNITERWVSYTPVTDSIRHKYKGVNVKVIR